jgi:hypothetical protein
MFDISNNNKVKLKAKESYLCLQFSLETKLSQPFLWPIMIIVSSLRAQQSASLFLLLSLLVVDFNLEYRVFSLWSYFIANSFQSISREIFDCKSVMIFTARQFNISLVSILSQQLICVSQINLLIIFSHVSYDNLIKNFSWEFSWIIEP